MCTLSPDQCDLGETAAALRFGDRAQRVVNRVCAAEVEKKNNPPMNVSTFSATHNFLFFLFVSLSLTGDTKCHVADSS